MNLIAERVVQRLSESSLSFSERPIIIGGMAMEYYGMRKSGADIDLVISGDDYIAIAENYPEKRKDLYGDLGVVVNEFEIWRSIALFDYDFFLKDAIELDEVFIVSLDRLLFMRVLAMDVEKYRKDLLTMKEYYCRSFRNTDFIMNAEKNASSYRELNGAVFGGKYLD